VSRSEGSLLIYLRYQYTIMLILIYLSGSVLIYLCY